MNESCFLQTCPERPSGMHTSVPIVAFVEWKLLMVLEGKWNFRLESSKEGQKALSKFITAFRVRVKANKSDHIRFVPATGRLVVSTTGAPPEETVPVEDEEEIEVTQQ